MLLTAATAQRAGRKHGAVNVHLVKLVVRHIDTLRGKGRTTANLFLYFGIPLAAAMLFAPVNYRISAGLFTAMVVSLSIFSSLLFSLHMMIYTYMKKVSGSNDRLIGYLFRLYINVTFCILVSVTAITALFIYGLKNQIGGGTALPWASDAIGRLAAASLVSGASSLVDLLLIFIIYYLLFVFLGTLFLILGRVHVIIEKDPAISQL